MLINFIGDENMKYKFMNMLNEQKSKKYKPAYIQFYFKKIIGYFLNQNLNAKNNKNNEKDDDDIINFQK